MQANLILAKLRDKTPLSAEEYSWFANGLADGAVSDAQAGAFAMAIVLNGVGDDGRVHLTEAMRDSGDVLTWDMPGPVLDKHSTGGVGDSVSLLLAPALAACGAFVPMISGRGLGHTGGTLDKLESLPGYRVDVSETRLRTVVAEVGCAIVGATGHIAPADKRLYAVRDVTGTVESRDLITASILSKKLAAGLEGLVLDVKCGSGAFMKTPEAARALAEALVSTSNGANCPCLALVTDMSQSLASTAGNALEMGEVLDILTHRADNRRLVAVTTALGGALLRLGGLADSDDAGEAMIEDVLASGAAAERFARMVRALGGRSDVLEAGRATLPEAPVVREVTAPVSGVLGKCDTEMLGRAVVSLGGGRLRQDDVLDLSVGLSEIAELGTSVARGDPIAKVHASREDAADAAVSAVLNSFEIGERFEDTPLVIERVS